MSARPFADRRRLVRALRRFNRRAEGAAVAMLVFLACLDLLVWS
jgi:hypothetical protein